MNRVALWAGFFFVLSVGGSFAQVNKIDLYADATVNSCEIVDDGFALQTVYAFLTGPNRAISVRFKAPMPPCWEGATWVGDTVPVQNTGTGNSQTDWLVTFYSPCPSPPVFVGSINFIANGLASPCCDMIVMAPSPNPFPRFVYVDCIYGEHPLAAGQKVVINPNETCRCQNPLAVETTTWGRVKSLYR